MLIAGRRWFLVQQASALLGRFPAVLLQELSYQPPPLRLVRVHKQDTQACHRQWLIPRRTLPHTLTLVHRQADLLASFSPNTQGTCLAHARISSADVRLPTGR